MDFKAAVVEVDNEQFSTIERVGLLSKFYSENYSKILALKEVILDLQEDKDCTLNGGRNLEIISENLTVLNFFINKEKGVYEITESTFNDIIEEFENIPYKIAISRLSEILYDLNNVMTRESPILITPCYNCLVWCNEEVKRLNKTR